MFFLLWRVHSFPFSRVLFLTVCLHVMCALFICRSIAMTLALRARALDTFLEDGCVRSPLSGLFPKDLPVPSLHTALFHLGQMYSDLAPDSKCVKLARRHAKTIDPAQKSGMSEDEVLSITIYTMEAYPREHSLYYMMNEALRGKDRAGVKRWRDFIWLLLHAMRKIPQPNERRVYRGIKIELGVFGSSRPNLTKGDEITWSAFSSTATTMDVMNDFLGQEGERIMYDIELTEPTARDIRPFSLFPSENELLHVWRPPPVAAVRKKSGCSPKSFSKPFELPPAMPTLFPSHRKSPLVPSRACCPPCPST